MGTWDAVHEKFTAALEVLVARIQRDRSTLVAILWAAFRTTPSGTPTSTWC